METAVTSWNIRWFAEVVVRRSSGCHRGRAGDQDARSERQENSHADKMGCGSNTRNASCSVVSSEWRGAEMVLLSPGEVLMENQVARTYLVRADFEQ